MAISDMNPQYRKEDNLILIVCLQEQMLKHTRCRRNMVKRYMIIDLEGGSHQLKWDQQQEQQSQHEGLQAQAEQDGVQREGQDAEHKHVEGWK